MLSLNKTLTRQEANARIEEIKKEIEAKWNEIEELCDEHRLSVSRPDEDAYRQYYVQDKEHFTEVLGYDFEDDCDWIDWEARLPGWIGSSEVGG